MFFLSFHNITFNGVLFFLKTLLAFVETFLFQRKIINLVVCVFPFPWKGPWRADFIAKPLVVSLKEMCGCHHGKKQKVAGSIPVIRQIFNLLFDARKAFLFFQYQKTEFFRQNLCFCDKWSSCFSKDNHSPTQLKQTGILEYFTKNWPKIFWIYKKPKNVKSL